MFMVAGIYFLRDLLLFVFTGCCCACARSSAPLRSCSASSAALLSAFLDALTVIAVIVTVGLGFYAVYHRVASGKRHEDEHDPSPRRRRAGAASRGRSSSSARSCAA